MRKFQVNYHDNSGPKSEVFEADSIDFGDKWVALWKTCRLVIAIPTEMIYSVEELDETS